MVRPARDREAKSIWADYYDQHYEEQYDLTGDVEAAWSKLIGYAARFALLFHCIKQVSQDQSVLTNIDANTLSQAILLSDWFKHEADRFYMLSSMSERERELLEYAAWVKRKFPNGVEIRKFQAGFRHITTSDEAEQILLEMKARKLAVSFQKENGTRVFKC